MKRSKEHRKQQRQGNKKRKLESFISLISDRIDNENNETKEKLEDEMDKNDMSALKAKLKSKLSQQKPKFVLLNSSVKADVEQDSEHECLAVHDIRDLILACILPAPRISNPPKWCKVIRSQRANKVNVFLIDYDKPIKLDKSYFSEIIRFTPSQDWLYYLMYIPLSNRQIYKLHMKGDPVNCDGETNDLELFEKIGVSRTELLLTRSELEKEKYVVGGKNSDLVPSKLNYSPVTDSSPIFSVDCEMCYTSANKLELARVSVVNEKLEIVYDTLVKPKNRIKNYLTKFSGITKKMLDPVTVTLDMVQQRLVELLPDDAILCGQSLNCDLDVLKMTHPYIIDTSVIYNLSGNSHIKSSLKLLSAKFLKLDIQNDEKGHNSCEDATAAMKLVKLKMKMGKDFGNRILQKNSTSWDLETQTMNIKSYLQTFDVKLNVYYDHLNLPEDEKYSIVTLTNDRILKCEDVISRVICNEKTICLVITKQGLCYIKF